MCVYLYMYAYIYVCVCVSMCVCVCLCLCMYVHMCVHPRAQVCMCACACAPNRTYRSINICHGLGCRRSPQVWLCMSCVLDAHLTDSWCVCRWWKCLLFVCCMDLGLCTLDVCICLFLCECLCMGVHCVWTVCMCMWQWVYILPLLSACIVCRYLMYLSAYACVSVYMGTLCMDCMYVLKRGTKYVLKRQNSFSSNWVCIFSFFF